MGVSSGENGRGEAGEKVDKHGISGAKRAVGATIVSEVGEAIACACSE